MIRRPRVFDSSHPTNLILGEDRAEGFESPVFGQCHPLKPSNIANSASVNEEFTKVNNPASIDSDMHNPDLITEGEGLSLGEIVQAARLFRDMTQEELGAKLGKSQRWVSDLERGKTAIPRRRNLALLSDALGVDLAQLYVAADLARDMKEARRMADETPEIPADDPRAEFIDMIKQINFTDNPDWQQLIRSNLKMLLDWQWDRRSLEWAAEQVETGQR